MEHSDKPTPKNALLLEKALRLPGKLKVGVVNPISANSLTAAITAAEDNIIKPTLVGPKEVMVELGKELGKDVTKYDIIDIEDPVATAQKVAQLARDGKIAAIMKGDIHTDELMRVVLSRDNGLRTKRRVSHCLVMDIPTYDKIMLFADVAVNVVPDITAKKDIIQNSIDFALSLGIKEPQVALLSAIETVHEYMPSTIDAAILCKMAQRGQITGGLVDGPLSIDLAVDKEAMELKHFVPVLKDKPDIFIAPDLDSGNIAIKILDYMANGQSSGLVLGAKVPIILMRRSSPAVEYLMSCALAKIYCNHR